MIFSKFRNYQYHLGSGKSTFADNLVSSNPERYVRICQDQLKTRKKCENKCRQALASGRVPIIDRCNVNPEQRKHFIEVASEFDNCQVDCIFFDYSKETCIKRCETRSNHETLNNADGKLIRQVVSRMNTMLQLPEQNTDWKSFRLFTAVKSFDQARTIMTHYVSSE